MGLFRALGTLASGGLIDPRSRDWRQTRYARQSRDALQTLAREQRTPARPAPAPAPAPSPELAQATARSAAAHDRLAAVRAIRARVESGELTAAQGVAEIQAISRA